MEAAAPPETPSPSALEGTRAHELLEKLLALRGEPAEQIMATAGYPDEMVGNIFRVLEYVDTLLDSDPDAMLFSEVGFRLPSVVLGPLAFGTCDIVVWLPNLRELHIIDYKNGVEIVDEKNNLQLRYYGAGAWFTVPGLAGGVDRVAITIVQPNAFAASGPIRTWWTDPDNLIDFVAELDEAAARAQAPDAPLVPHIKTCRHCKAHAICPAAKAKAIDAAIRGASDIKLVNTVNIPDPKTMSLDELAYAIDAIEYMRQWADSVEEAAFGLALRGHMFPNRKLVRKITRRRYDGKPEEIAEGLCVAYGLELDQVMPRKLLTLTDMETLISKTARETAPRGKKKEAAQEALENFAFFTVKPPSDEYTLVGLDDRRPAENPIARQTAGITLPAIPAPSK